MANKKNCYSKQRTKEMNVNDELSTEFTIFCSTAYSQNGKEKKILYYVLGYIELRTYKVFLST